MENNGWIILTLFMFFFIKSVAEDMIFLPLPEIVEEAPVQIIRIQTLDVNTLDVNTLRINSSGDKSLLSSPADTDLIDSLQVYRTNPITNHFLKVLQDTFDSGDILTGDEVEAALAMIDILQLILL